jgi:hypothetical protein
MRGLRLANVQVELDKLLAVRLRDAGDVRKLFDALKVGRRRRPWRIRRRRSWLLQPVIFMGSESGFNQQKLDCSWRC